MSLERYRNKRNFRESSEPPGNFNSSQEARLRFVIHKHQASHLHYDLRLELHGVLKSWAVPKEITLDTLQKRLAIMVEDHPLEYHHPVQPMLASMVEKPFDRRDWIFEIKWDGYRVIAEIKQPYSSDILP
jgi:ATP-dependent DNA ligase